MTRSRAAALGAATLAAGALAGSVHQSRQSVHGVHTLYLPRVDASDPPATPTPLIVNPVAALLAHRDRIHRTPGAVGYGRHAGDGADQWPERRVDTAAELVDALAETGPLVVVLARDVKLSAPAAVTSHKALIGESHRSLAPTISGHGLSIRGAEHVIVSQVRIEGVAGDGIDISRGSRHVWIDRVDLSRATDGLLDITRGATDITVSESYFHDHTKVMLIGASDSHVGDSQIRVSLFGNRFERVGMRLPSVRFATVESVANARSGWTGGTAIDLRLGARFVTCRDVWGEDGHNRTRITANSGATWSECQR